MKTSVNRIGDGERVFALGLMISHKSIALAFGFHQTVLRWGKWERTIR